MEKESLKKKIKREVVRAMLERTQSIDLEKLGGPSEENAVHFENVEEILNIPYMNRDEIPLAMDIFKPIVPEGTENPVIVTIHGGGLTMGDRKISRPFGRILASKGYLVFSIEYRLAPRANVCMELDDICAGLDLVGERLVDYEVDFNRIFIAAESAGAYLAAYVTAMKKSVKLQEAIGYKPTRVSFKAIGLLSGMLYTNRKDPNGWMLAEQIYGDKRTDENFLEYMNPEHPEIINNLPPAYIVTSKADFLNSYSILINEALKRAGKPCHLLYYGDDELQHAFTALQTDNPKAVESIDKMLAWFEEQAQISMDREKNKKSLAAKKKKVYEAMKDGSFDNQKVWQYVKERANIDPDRLYAPAIMDCSRTYTYAQMFDQWDKYARVFSGLGITEKNKSRVAIVGTISAEPIFSYYGCNMTGATVSMFSYPDLLPGGRWKTMLEKEHITDMIVSDIMVPPQMWEEIKKAKNELGLKNVILLHSRMGGPTIGYAEMFFNEFNYTALRRIPDVQFMSDLIEKYKDEPIQYAKKSGDGIAVICHTSGTSNGTRKPLPYTDRTVNSMASDSPTGIASAVIQIIKARVEEKIKDLPDKLKEMILASITEGAGMDDIPEGVKKMMSAGGTSFSFGRMVMIPPFDFSSSSNINGFVNTSLASGNSIVTTFFGFLHPKFVRCFKYYNVGVVFSSGFMVDQWMKNPDIPDDAFSSLKVLGLGGSYISPSKLEKYRNYLKEHGFTGTISQGYGMSELANSIFFIPQDCKEEDILGFPDDLNNYRILDESDGKFYKLDEGKRDGVLYGRSKGMCLNELDGETIFEYTEIDGLNYVCTNDVIHINPSGSLSYVGRSNQYFANNEGVKFESGLVAKQIASHPNINHCAIVPVLDKRIHDTVPVLYAVPEHKNRDAAEQVKEAIADAYIKKDSLKESVLPTQFIVVDSIPFNASGKIDVYTITRSRLKGSAFNIIPVKKDGVLVDINYEKAEQLNSYTAGNLPGTMGSDSAFGIFDLFSGTSEYNKYKNALKVRKEKLDTDIETFKSLLPGLKFNLPKIPIDAHGMLQMPALPKSLMFLAALSTILIGDMESKDYDYEE